jgi:hypothetical protein
MRTGRPRTLVLLNTDERQHLESMAHRSQSAPHLARRARIILACAEGRATTIIAKRLHLLPNPPNGAAGLPTTTPANPNWPIVNLDRNLPAQTPTQKTHHIHGTPVYMGRATSGIIYLWGENERLKAYNFNFGTKRITGFRGEGTQFASGNMAAPGGMPGGRLVVSSNGTTPNTGVIWGV